MDAQALRAMAETVSHLLEMQTRVTGAASRSYVELLALAIRKVEEIAPVNVSTAAQAAADAHGLGDVRSYCWFCPAIGKHRHGDKNKRLFLWEHYVPVADTRRALASLGPKRTLDDVAALLGKTKIVWVLRDEGDKLGNQSRQDPAATYRDAGVSLLHSWDSCRPVDCRRHRSRSTSPRI